MRILWISSTCPFPTTDGNAQRNWHLLRHLAASCEITLISPVAAEQSAVLTTACEALGIACHPVISTGKSSRMDRIGTRFEQVFTRTPRVFFPRDLAALTDQATRLGESNPFDLAFGYFATSPVLLAAPARRVVVDAQNVEAVLYRRLYRHERSFRRKLARWTDWWAVAGYERRALPRFDAAVCCSALDREELRTRYPGLPEIEVIPNGVDVDHVPFEAPLNRAATVVMVGAMGSGPNTDAACFFVKEILPLIRERRPDVVFRIVGKGPSPAVRALARPGVEVVGEVPSVLPYLHGCAAMVVPLRSGGGTRLRILEAWAAGAAVVSTSVGAEGLGGIDGEHLSIADEPGAFAAAVLRMLDDAQRRATIARNARRFTETNYQWPHLAQRLGDFFGRVGGQAVPPARSGIAAG